ncbi:2-dehydropantoate 2-reductase N-terminal domain-containing protein, partial [Oscillibacter sp.]|uniref:2-dehydropantoate 2-reductase N-terminal domain-containing protein n=1 Tax=Oscillibacter sp. TaxID=1945593 RepID=UPI0028A91B60
MKAVVLGSGGWGTALAMVLCDNGHDVTLWSHSPGKAELMAGNRRNPALPDVELPAALKFSGEIRCVETAELVVSASPSYAVRSNLRPAASFLKKGTVLVSVSKGIERDTN